MPFGFRMARRGLVQPTFNPADADPDVTLSDGDRTYSMAASTTGGVRSKTSVGAVKVYWEVILNNAGSANRYGIATAAFTITGAPGHDANSWSVDGDGNVRYNSATALRDLGSNPNLNGGSYMFAYDGAAGKLWIGNADTGSWYESGDPAAGTGEQFSGITGPIFICCGRSAGGSTRGGTLSLVENYVRAAPSGFRTGV